MNRSSRPGSLALHGWESDMSSASRCVVGIALALACTHAAADLAAGRPLRLVVPAAPGGAPAIVGRVLAESMSVSLGRTVVVDPRPGAAGLIGARVVAQALPDGHTVLLATAAVMAVTPHVQPAGYDPLTGLTAVGMIQRGPYLVAVHPAVDARTFPELIALAKARPGELAYGTPGVGSVHHVTWHMLLARLGASMQHVPFSGPQMVPETMAGRTQAFLNSPSASLLQLGRSGRIRFIAQTGARRLEPVPEVATLGEQGIADFESYSWWGLAVPAGTPAAAIGAINRALNAALDAPSVRERLAAEGVPDERFARTPVEFARWIRAEHARYGPIIRDMKLQ
jgi:tripartite-type tricarboxylate transporter receptor subunit TctC